MASPIPDTLKVIYNEWVYSLPNAQEGPDVLMKEVVDFVANMAEDPRQALPPPLLRDSVSKDHHHA